MKQSVHKFAIDILIHRSTIGADLFAKYTDTPACGLYQLKDAGVACDRCCDNIRGGYRRFRFFRELALHRPDSSFFRFSAFSTYFLCETSLRKKAKTPIITIKIIINNTERPSVS